MERERDPRLERLATRLRDEGVPPERDLWPDIDSAIRQREEAGIRRPRTVWWRAMAAAAALLILVIGARDLLTGNPGATDGSTDGAPTMLVAENTDAPAGGMSTIEKALAELSEALAADPDNHNLSRLVLMVHRTRGELLRRSPDRGPHTGWTTGG